MLLSAAGAAPYRLAPISLRPQLRAPLVVCAARKSDTAGQGFGQAPEPRSRKPPARPAAASGLPAAAVDDSREASVLRGRAALERLREETGSASAATGRKLELTPEELEPMSPEEGVMPEVVSNRMLRRVVPFAGLPVFGSVLLFGGFWRRPRVANGGPWPRPARRACQRQRSRPVQLAEGWAMCVRHHH